MAKEFTDFYKELEIDLKGRKPSDITAEEIEAAYQKKKNQFDIKKKKYRKESMELHPDRVAASDAAKGLSAEEIELLKQANGDKLKPINQQWDKDRAAYDRAKHAFDGLSNAETRKRHDEAHEFEADWKRGARGSYSSRSNSSGASYTGQGSTGTGQGEGASTGQRGGGTKRENFWKDYADFSHQRNQQFYDDLNAHIDRARKAGKKPDLRKHNLSFRDLSNMDLEGCIFGDQLIDTKFCGANLKNADFSKKHLYECVFDDKTQLDGANFSNAFFPNGTNLPKHLKNVNFDSANFGFANTEKLAERTFEKCNFDNVYFKSQDFRGSLFKDCSFKNALLSFKTIKNVVFEGSAFGDAMNWAHLENVTFRNIQGDTDLTRAKLKDVKFEGSLKGLKLTEEQLKHVDLTKADTAELKLFDSRGRQVKNPFLKEESTVGGAAEHAAEGGARSVEGEAGKANGFVDRLLRTAEGEIHAGKVAALAAGTLAVGAAIYQVAKKQNRSWEEQVNDRHKDRQAEQIVR